MDIRDRLVVYAQKALEDCGNVAGGNRFLAGPGEPVAGVLVSMLPDGTSTYLYGNSRIVQQSVTGTAYLPGVRWGQ